MSSYVEKLDVIDEVRNTLSKLKDVSFYKEIDRELPVFIILGAQSSGKSSVIKRITNNKIKLPEKADMCTRVSTEVQLRKGDSTFQEVSLEGPEDFETVIINEKDIRQAVAQAQELALSMVKDQIFALDYTIVIKYSDPEQPNVTFIDMPGFTMETDAGEKAAKTLAENRVNKYPGTLVLHVVKANTDYGSVISSSFIRGVEKTTLTVLTHLDNRTEAQSYLDKTKKIIKENMFAVLGKCDDSQEVEEQQLKQIDFLTYDNEIGLGSKALSLKLEELMSCHLGRQIPIAIEKLTLSYRETTKRLEIIQEKQPAQVLYQLFSELKEKYLNSKEFLETNFRQLIEQLVIEIRNYFIKPLNEGQLKFQKLDSLDEVNIGDHVLLSPNNKKDNEEDNEDLAVPSEEEEESEGEEKNDFKIDLGKINMGSNNSFRKESESENVDSTQMVKGRIIEILTYPINDENEPRFKLKLDNGDIMIKESNDCYSAHCISSPCLLGEIQEEMNKNRGLRNTIHADRMPIIEKHAQKFSEYYSQVMTKLSKQFYSLLEKTYTEVFTSQENEINQIPLGKLKKEFWKLLKGQQQKMAQTIDRIQSYNQPPIVNTTNEHYLHQLIAKMMEGVDFSDDQASCKHIYFNIRAFIKDQRKFICEIASKEFQKTLLIECESQFNHLLDTSMEVLTPLIKDPEKIIREREVLGNKKLLLEKALSEFEKIDDN